MPTAPADGIYPAATRTALLGHVVEALYHVWQSGRDMDLTGLVATVHAARPHAPLVEIHGAIGRLECAGLIESDAETGRWRRREQPGPLLATCGTTDCQRADRHGGVHLPDLGAAELHAELVVHHDDFMAAWSPNSGYVHVHEDPSDWAAGNAPLESIPVPPGTPYTVRGLVAILSEWIAADHAGAYSPGRSDERHERDR